MFWGYQMLVMSLLHVYMGQLALVNWGIWEYPYKLMYLYTGMLGSYTDILLVKFTTAFLINDYY